MNGYYKHNKTGNLYFAEKLLINATNANDGQVMVEYYPCDKYRIPQWESGYVRELVEFNEKFTKYEEREQ